MFILPLRHQNWVVEKDLSRTVRVAVKPSDEPLRKGETKVLRLRFNSQDAQTASRFSGSLKAAMVSSSHIVIAIPSNILISRLEKMEYQIRIFPCEWRIVRDDFHPSDLAPKNY